LTLRSSFNSSESSPDISDSFSDSSRSVSACKQHRTLALSRVSAMHVLSVARLCFGGQQFILKQR
jgi:hypothetical protein